MYQIWRADTECPYEFYPTFKKLLDFASYHFADDSSEEWSKGYVMVQEAAELLVTNKVPFWAIKRMTKETKSLVDLDTLMQKMLVVLYGEQE
jgi:hypothetical protein